MNYCYYDFETCSAISLKTSPLHEYVNHYSTRVISAAFRFDGQTLSLHNATGIEELPREIKRLTHTHTFVAHNGELFDEPLWERFFAEVPTFEDTLHLARLAGYPGSLKALLLLVCNTTKADDTAMRLLMTAKYGPGSKIIYPKGTKALWEKLVAYNVQDVAWLEQVHLHLRKHLTPEEVRAIQTHREINARGFIVNGDYVSRLLALWSKVQRTAIDEIATITDGVITGDDIRSPAKVKRWLTSIGIMLPGDSLDRKTIDNILANPEEFQTDKEHEQAFALLAQRRNAVRATTGKLETMLNCIDTDSRIRRVIVYCGAQTTGRFSGRSVQPHNFPRGVGLDDASPAVASSHESLLRCATRNNQTPADVLGTLTRSTVQAPDGSTLGIVDYSAIEARVLPWLAGCSPLIQTYNNNNGDPYKLLASELFGVPLSQVTKQQRFVGKQGILASGYGAGGDKIALMCKMFGINLAAVGLTGDKIKTTYRQTFPEIPALWKAYNAAAIETIKHGIPQTVGKCVFSKVYDVGCHWFEIVLPSGRKLRYRNARVEPALMPWGAMGEQIRYDTPYGYPKKLYGGIITENIDQAISRDIMVHHANRTPFPIVLHVHDEIVYESELHCATGNLADQCERMSIAPPWAVGLPLGVEGFCSNYYTKIPPNHPVKYLNGKKV